MGDSRQDRERWTDSNAVLYTKKWLYKWVCKRSEEKENARARFESVGWEWGGVENDRECVVGHVMWKRVRDDVWFVCSNEFISVE